MSNPRTSGSRPRSHGSERLVETAILLSLYYRSSIFSFFLRTQKKTDQKPKNMLTNISSSASSSGKSLYVESTSDSLHSDCESGNCHETLKFIAKLRARHCLECDNLYQNSKNIKNWQKQQKGVFCTVDLLYRHQSKSVRFTLLLMIRASYMGFIFSILLSSGSRTAVYIHFNK